VTRRSARLQEANYLDELISQEIATAADLDLFGNLPERCYLNGSDMVSGPFGN